MNNYIVYFVRVEGELVYIGSGKYGRQNHCVSGTSHSYDLNRCHHTGIDMCVSIYRKYLTKEESLALEKELIILHQPRFNKVYVDDIRIRKGGAIASIIRQLKISMRKVYGDAFYYKYKDGVNGLVKFLCKQKSIFTDGCLVQTWPLAKTELQNDAKAKSLFRRGTEEQTKEKFIIWISEIFHVEEGRKRLWLKVKDEYNFS